MLTIRIKIFNQTKQNKIRLILFLILILAAFFRLYGLDWDQGQHLHPDERFLTMVLSAMKIPKTLGDYLNPKVSKMNPYNLGYGFFVYGTFPLNLTKIIGVVTNNNDYGTIHFVGRILSAFFDIGTVYLVYLISKKLLHHQSPTTQHLSLNTPLLAAFLYSIMVLPIQLSHFFAVDTFLNFFILLSFYFLILLISNPLITNYQLLITPALLGGAFGLALACKISAVLFLPIIGTGFFLSLIKNRKIPLFIVHCSLFIFFVYIFFRFNQPQAFADNNWLNFNINPQFSKNLAELKSSTSPDTWMPPSIQWKTTKPIIFPLKNLVLWGLGLPLGIICITSVIFSITPAFASAIRAMAGKQLLNYLITKKQKLPITNYQLLITLWILLLFAYQGLQFAKSMRYFLPIYPFLALLSAQLIYEISKLLKKRIPNYFCLLSSVFCLLVLIYPVSFMNIYTKPITRVSASKWIYENIPPGSTLLNEEWDDGLPLSFPGKTAQIYDWQAVFTYDQDSQEKWQRINQKLAKTDYIIITSNRAYGATMKMPERYPQTISYYQSLFEDTGNFKKVAEFTSYPCFPPGKYNLFCFNDDSSEEAFTVYDHPKVMIFKKLIK